ncbi:MAG TPA: hypothetical protein VMU15_14050 [Anaeromyxobacter sp.]|nr:hypothetical protein [Anaeromyxobacter sp.]
MAPPERSSPPRPAPPRTEAAWSRQSALRVLAVACLAAVLPAVGLAAETSTEGRLRDALRTATSQLRAAEDDRARLQSESAERLKEIEDLKAKLAAAQVARPAPRPNDRERVELTRRLEERSETAARLGKELAQCQATSGAAADAAREAARRLEEEHARREQAAAEGGELGEKLADCRTRNGRLYRVAEEILERYQRMTLGDVVAAREPFVGAKRVELENQAQDYEDRLRDQLAPKAPR